MSSQGHRSVSVSRHFLLQAPQCPCMRNANTFFCLSVCVCLYVCLSVCMSVCVCLYQLVPLLKLLYHAPDGSSHHLNYMALIVILILSEDTCFSKSVHEIVRTLLTYLILVFLSTEHQWCLVSRLRCVLIDCLCNNSVGVHWLTVFCKKTSHAKCACRNSRF